MASMSNMTATSVCHIFFIPYLVIYMSKHVRTTRYEIKNNKFNFLKASMRCACGAQHVKRSSMVPGRTQRQITQQPRNNVEKKCKNGRRRCARRFPQIPTAFLKSSQKSPLISSNPPLNPHKNPHAFPQIPTHFLKSPLKSSNPHKNPQ